MRLTDEQVDDVRTRENHVPDTEDLSGWERDAEKDWQPGDAVMTAADAVTEWNWRGRPLGG